MSDNNGTVSYFYWRYPKMSKIICDICGTTYPETAECCPICGCSNADAAELLNTDVLNETIPEESNVKNVNTKKKEKKS